LILKFSPVKGIVLWQVLLFESGSSVFVLLAVVFFILMSYLLGAHTCARHSSAFLCLPFQPP